MDRPDPDKPRTPAPGFSLLRPAVPPRSPEAPSRRTDMDRSLGPFAPRRGASPPPPPEESSGVDELPWAVLDAPLWDEPAATAAPEAGQPEVSVPAAQGFDYETDEISPADEAEWLEY